MSDQVVQLLTKAKKILIVPNTQNNGDILFASLALNSALTQTGRQAYILSNRLSNSALWKFKLKQFKNIHSIAAIPSRLQLTLDQKELHINDLSWELSKGKYHIYLDTGSTDALPGQVKFKQSRMDFNLIIAVGSINSNALLNAGLDPELLQNTDHLFIANTKMALNNTVIPEPQSNASKSFCLRIRDLLGKADIAIPKDSATMLLAGIISHTNTFRKSISLELFDKITELVKDGADYQAGYQLAVQDLTLKKAKLLSEILNNVKEIGPGIYFSQGALPAGQKLKLKINEVLKLAEIYDCRLAVVAVRSGAQNLVYLKSNDSKIDLKKILAELKGKGNTTQGLIITSQPLAKLREQIIALVLGIKSTPKIVTREKYEQFTPVAGTVKADGFDPLVPAAKTPEPLQLGQNQIRQSPDFSPLPSAAS